MRKQVLVVLVAVILIFIFELGIFTVLNVDYCKHREVFAEENISNVTLTKIACNSMFDVYKLVDYNDKNQTTRYIIVTKSHAYSVVVSK